jgi:cell division protein FtsX
MTTSALQNQPLEELAQDPLLTVASVLLIVVAVGWIVVSRLVSRNLRRTAARAAKKKGAVRPAKDIWTEPP